MLVYRDDARPADCQALLRALQGQAARLDGSDADAAVSLLIDAGEFEAAAVDALSPDRDEWTPAIEALRRATEAAADAWLDADSRSISRATSKPILRALDAISRATLPERLVRRVSEGYAYYGLFPATYAASARAFVDDCRPHRVVCVGLRSIGTGLCAAVATELRRQTCDVWTCTVRPRGHPFDRRLVVGDGLRAEWRQRAAQGAWFAIVDEGPGLSGSSFAAAIETIVGLGVPADRIVLFPAWDPDPSRLRSVRARTVWRAHRRYWMDAARVGVTPERAFGLGTTVEWSAGRWRAAHGNDPREWPPAHPAHERWKVHAPDAGLVVKFAGLGRYGERARRRAGRLHACGLGPAPGPLRSGFLAMPWIDGQPLAPGRLETDGAAAIGRYIGRIAVTFPAERSPAVASLRDMIETNAREAFGDGTADAVAALVAGSNLARLENGTAAAIDGRMLPHEWLATAGGLVKVDALDHHADHFFPGTQDAAWDVAACLQEFAPSSPVARALIDGCTRTSGDAALAARLPFYRAAYAAFRLGYATLAMEDLAGTPEERRFVDVRDRAAAVLATALGVTSPSAP